MSQHPGLLTSLIYRMHAASLGRRSLINLVRIHATGQARRVPEWAWKEYSALHGLLISQDVGKMCFRQISLNIYILYQK